MNKQVNERMNQDIVNYQTISVGDSAAVQDVVTDALACAKQHGASAAEVGASISVGFSVTVRMGTVDTVEYHRDKGIGVTVYFGQRKGSASTTDTSPEAIKSTVEAACHIAKVTSEDECAGLADKALMAFDYPDLDLSHPWGLTVEEAIEKATSCEDFGRSLDKRITNSEGVTIATNQTFSMYGNSHGFIGGYPSTRHYLGCVLVAKEGEEMQRDHYYTTARDVESLGSGKDVARQAVDRTVKRLGARSIPTCESSVIFAADIARSLIGNFLSSISGGNLYRRSSFLCDMLENPVFAPHIHLYERPHLLKGLGSAPFDSEGVKTNDKDIVSDGVLRTYLLDSYSGRKLGMQTTGNADGVYNLFIDTSELDFDALLKEMDTGLLVTELMGQGVNIITGDYSRGVVGYWVEKGEIQFPVEGITIAGNLRDMFLNLLAVGNDVDIRGNIRTGSILLDKMIIAGI